jgi:hypothetical protein
MKFSLKTLVNPQKVALARARFNAWWEGDEFDPQAFSASQEHHEAALPLEETVADEPPPREPRVLALETLWGANRLMPGADQDDRLLPARIGLPATGTLAVFGPGLAGPIAAAAEAHPGKFVIYEWREEVLAQLSHRLAQSDLKERCTVRSLDLDLFSAPADAWDGVWSLDEFSFAPNPSRLAVQLAKGMKPGAVAVIECYVQEGRFQTGSAFAAAFGEPHLPASADMLSVLSGAGLTIEEETDIGSDHLTEAKEGFRRLEQALSAAANAGLEAGVAREIAWEAESWAHRMAALSSGKLSRHRFIVRKPD